MARPSGNRDRRVVVDEMRRKQQAADRRRTLLIVGASALVAILIVGAAVVAAVRSNEDSDKPLADLGAAASAAGCQDLVTKSAEGSRQHVQPGSPVTYEDSPPAFGPHYPTPQPMTRKFYTSDDRPAVATLVHNLEHGFTLLWYDETIAGDDGQLDAVRAITEQYPATSGLDDKFMAVPWTKDDGDPFPDGAHVALTHWSNGGTNGNPDEQTGVWQYCDSVSGDVVKQFVHDFPFTDAPEGKLPG